MNLYLHYRIYKQKMELMGDGKDKYIGSFLSLILEIYCFSNSLNS